MLSSKELTIKGLIQSKDGIHLTGYIQNREADPSHLKEQLSQIRNEAYEFLAPVMSVDERIKFLAPIDHLLSDLRVMIQMKGNIGIFRKKDAFRVLSLPVDVEPSCIVATSFHVKPLLRWIQTDQGFLLLGLNPTGAFLFSGDQNSLSKIDSFSFEPLPLYGDEREADVLSSERRIFSLLKPIHFWLTELTSHTRPRLFVAGDPTLTKAFCEDSTYTNLELIPINDSFDESQLNTLAERVRKLRRREVALKLEKAILEFHLAEEMNLAKKNIFQIAKAAVQGRVRKLIVADGIRIFGKIDPKSGGLAIHPYDLDHEDDDLLDDLAQTVIAQGGEVIVASRDEIPKGRPILAILNEKTSETLTLVEKIKNSIPLNKEMPS